jgi:hypothetical protein
LGTFITHRRGKTNPNPRRETMDTNTICKHPVVETCNEWPKDNPTRIYLNLKGYRRSFRGCQTSKVYWDIKGERLVVTMGKGTCPSEYLESIDAIQEACK